MKGSFTLKLLEIIAGTTEDVADVFEAFLSAGYGASQGKISHEISKIQNRREREKREREEYLRHYRRYYNLISWLQRDGLIEKQKENNKSFVLTAKGKKKLSILRKQVQIALPESCYETKANTQFVIVAFNIPESEHRKRAWLRNALKHMGFTMLQKSVWGGKVLVPKAFLDDLLRLRLVDFVEIFEITRSGSLRHLA